MVKLAISGCQGRMGLRILHLAQEDPELKIVTLLEKENHPAVGGQMDKVPISSDPQSLKGANVLIDFTSPEATLEHLEICKKLKIKMVIGTTGLLEEHIQKIREASKSIAIVFSSNMSVGVNILFGLTRQIAQKTDRSYTVRIIEAHHIHKKDAPSGTAKTLASIVQEVTQEKVSDIQSIREGEIVGDHDVIFESPVDTITIRHHAKTRDIFAKGALVAAKFIATKRQGLFNMEEVLALKK